ncbi:MAG: hypothetical protein ACSHX9_00890 [Luteolibacter sp.]
MENFPDKLRFWFFHCIINALPSYLIAVIWLRLWIHPIAHVAMGCAVLTFVLGYSVLTSLPGPLTERNSLFARAMRVGLRIRMIISILTVCVVPTGVFILFTPDYWCGQLAVNLVSEFYHLIGVEPTLMHMVDYDWSFAATFMEIYLSTLLEGLILSFMLFIFSVIAIIILQMRDRKKMFREGRI